MRYNSLVSILIPVFNAEKYISETIESVLSQTWGNKEIIIVNDGSTDNTATILKKFDSKDVLVINQENKGACSARNEAYKVAQGEFIQFMD